MCEAGGRPRLHPSANQLLHQQTLLARYQKREAWGKTGSSWRSFVSLRTVA
jgi:hypothetical protein